MLSKKLVHCGLSVLIFSYGTHGFAQNIQPLSEAEFNQQLQIYIDRVNQTKAILDDPNAPSSAEFQKQALCQRIQAYQNIAQFSQEHPENDSAKLMGSVAENYLARQKQSFEHAGWNVHIFCDLKQPEQILEKP